MPRGDCSVKQRRASWMWRSTWATAIPAISRNCSEEKQASPRAIIVASADRHISELPQKSKSFDGHTRMVAGAAFWGPIRTFEQYRNRWSKWACDSHTDAE